MTKQKVSKQKWKAGNMVYPIPAAMVSCGDHERSNIVTVGWTGTICTNPPMTYISLRPSRYSYHMIKETGYFVINLTTVPLVRATDYCGVKSGREVDKFKEMNLTVLRDEDTTCPMIEESPVNIVCKTKEIKELGSHHMFIADVLHVYIDEAYLDEKGKFHLNATDLLAYSHGSYLSLGEELGSFGYSIRKNKRDKEKNRGQVSQTKDGQMLGPAVKKNSAHKKNKPKEKISLVNQPKSSNKINQVSKEKQKNKKSFMKKSDKRK